MCKPSFPPDLAASLGIKAILLLGLVALFSTGAGMAYAALKMIGWI